MYLLTILSLLFLGRIQPSDTLIVNPAINTVKVFLSGGEVSGNAEFILQPGMNIISLTGLPARLNEETVQLSINSNTIIRGISIKHKPKAGNIFEERLNKLKSQKKVIQTKINEKNTALIVLERKTNLLLANQDLSGKNEVLSVDALKGAVEYFGEKFSEIEQKKVEIENRLKKLEKQLSGVNNEIQEIKRKRVRAGNVIEAAIYSPSRMQVEAQLSYVVNNAYWYPSYDVRVEDIDQPLKLIYKANIYQSTGVDWQNVHFTISSVEPQSGISIPQMDPIYLSFNKPRAINLDADFDLREAGSVKTAGERGISRVYGLVQNAQGEPIPTANVMVLPAGNNGTSTNIEGIYSLSVPPSAKYLRASFVGYQTRTVPIYSSNINITLRQGNIALQEVVVTGYGRPMQTNLQEGQTNFSFELAKPYTVKSGDAAKTFTVKTHEIEADYQYITIPKKSEEAYLTAKIADWSDLHLLNGEANLYLGNTFVGSTRLELKTAGDTLQFSLGNDESIIIERTKIEEFTEKNFFGNEITETKGWKITIKNTKDTPIQIKAIDQVPLSSNEDIVVHLTKQSGASYDSSTGKLTWHLKLKPKSTKTVSFIYEIEYPDDKTLEKYL